MKDLAFTHLEIPSRSNSRTLLQDWTNPLGGFSGFLSYGSVQFAAIGSTAINHAVKPKEALKGESLLDVFWSVIPSNANLVAPNSHYILPVVIA